MKGDFKGEWGSWQYNEELEDYCSVVTEIMI